MPSATLSYCKTSTTKSASSGQVRRYTFHAQDDGLGGIGGEAGDVNYATGEIVLPVLPEISQSVWDTNTESNTRGSWGGQAGSSGMGFNSGIVVVSYTPAGAADDSFDDEELSDGLELKIQFIPAAYDERLQPGGLLFAMGGHLYTDRLGTLYRDPSPATGSGTACGRVDYLLGAAFLDDPAEAAPVTVLAMLTKKGDFVTTEASFRTAISPVKPESLSITATAEDGAFLSASADQDGKITGAWMDGAVNYQFGTAAIKFGKWETINPGTPQEAEIWTPRRVDPATIRYNAVSYRYLPLDAALLGLDPVRLPSDGRVPIYRPGDFVVLGNSATWGPDTVSNGQTVGLGRVRLSRVKVLDAGDQPVTSGYSHDLEAGTVTFTSTAGYSQPVRIEHRVEDLLLVSDAQITGPLTFTRAVTHAYPKDTSYISSAVMGGDLRSRVSHFFDQKTWDGIAWLDALSGDQAPASYNNIDYPPTVTNEGAITERWALHFTSSSTFEIKGEHLGTIGTGNTSSITAPINPNTLVPYFSLPAEGWGSGWSIGNVLRLNTVGCQLPVWVCRTVQQGPEAGIDYRFSLLARGSVDRS